MKNLIITIIAIFATTVLNAQLIASLSTVTEGGVYGKIETITPQVNFHEKGTALSEFTNLFDGVEVVATDSEITYTINSDDNDAQFTAFCELLRTNTNASLRIGHKANKVKSYVGRSIADWFDGQSFENVEIAQITITYTKVAFVSPGKDLSADGNWTDFSYEVTLNIYGTKSLSAQAE